MLTNKEKQTLELSNGMSKDINQNTNNNETIAAIATPSGAGGVGIIRISGSESLSIVKHLIGKSPVARKVYYANFMNSNGQTLDSGVVLYFSGPNSYTGEDVVELQGHGGIYVLKSVLNRVLELGAKLARPGEFTERAFLNGKLDLVQAEAVADLIESRSQQAAFAAIRSLSGEFSTYVNNFQQKIIYLRTFVEASLDFSDEEIDFLGEEKIKSQLKDLQNQIQETIGKADYGKRLNNGINIVLVGKPNVGKSSLLNQLLGYDRAIVTEQAGTTRDTLEESINIYGIPVNIIDTAGLRETTDFIELAGIEKTKQAIEKADLVIWLRDLNGIEKDAVIADDIFFSNDEIYHKDESFFKNLDFIEVRNKSDLITTKEINAVVLQKVGNSSSNVINISAKTGVGIDDLLAAIADRIGVKQSEENAFSARQRHIEALKQTQKHIDFAVELIDNQTIELVAEELRLAQKYLSEITGEYCTDDLLGAIFSSFCIGK